MAFTSRLSRNAQRVMICAPTVRRAPLCAPPMYGSGLSVCTLWFVCGSMCVCVCLLWLTFSRPPSPIRCQSNQRVTSTHNGDGRTVKNYTKIYFNTMFNTLTAYAEGERPLTLLTHALTTSKAK